MTDKNATADPLQAQAPAKKPVKPWQQSMHAQEVKDFAATLGLTVREAARGKFFELVDATGRKQFTVHFTSRNEFHYATTALGVHYGPDYRTHAYRSTPRQVLNLFREHAQKNYRPPTITP